MPNRPWYTYVRTLAPPLALACALAAAPAHAQAPEPAQPEQVELDRNALLEAISQTLGAAVEAGELPEADAVAVMRAAEQMNDEELIAYAQQLGVLPGAEAEQAAVPEAEAQGAEGLGAGMDPAALEAVCVFEDKKQSIACVVAKLEAARQSSFEKASEARLEKAGKKTRLALSVVLVAMVFAPLFLLLPFVYRKRFQGSPHKQELFKWSALAGGLYLINMVLFGISLALLRTFQAVGGSQTDPKLAVLDGSFRTLLKNAEGLADVFPAWIAPALDAGEDIVMGLLGHFQTLVANAEVLARFAERFQSLQGLLDNVGLLFALIAVILFGLGFKESFKRIIQLPAAIVEARSQGESDAAKTMSKAALASTLSEMKVVGVFLGAIVVVTTLSGMLLKASIVPAAENMIAQLLVALFYMFAEADAASSGTIGLGLGSATFVVVLAVVMTLASSGMYLSRVQKLLRAHFHAGVALRDHWKFFVYGGLIIVGLQLFPYSYMSGVNAALDSLMHSYEVAKEMPPFAFLLRAVSPMVVLGWLVLFWAARGHKGILWILKYPVPKLGESEEQAA